MGNAYLCKRIEPGYLQLANFQISSISTHGIFYIKVTACNKSYYTKA